MSAHPNPSLEPRPRDFGAQFKRRRVPTLGLRLQRRHRGRRALVLFAAFAVPALAAPGDWDAFGIGNAGSADIAVEPLPFERPGESFPGSAFYYLAQDEALPPLVEMRSDATGASSWWTNSPGQLRGPCGSTIRESTGRARSNA